MLLASYAVQAKVGSKKKRSFFPGTSVCHRGTPVVCVLGFSGVQREFPQQARGRETCELGEPSVDVSLLYNLVSACVCLCVQISVYSLIHFLCNLLVHITRKNELASPA